MDINPFLTPIPPQSPAGSVCGGTDTLRTAGVTEQNPPRRSALIAMSGGVDSTVAALLAMREGYDCAGATMRLHSFSAATEADAQEACGQLGIPYFVFDFSEAFATLVIQRFVTAYREGRTPNPCVDCNRRMKFGLLMEKARELGKENLITGHYARVGPDVNGRFLLKKAADESKDQSYVLYSLTQEQLARIRLPLGTLSKQQARLLAADAGFSNALKRESQDICFIPGGDYAGFITEYTGEAPRKGRFVDAGGNDLGEHKGIGCYTIGQRRGLGLAMPYPPYVLDIRPEDGRIIVGRSESLFSKAFYMRDINLIPLDRLDAPVRVSVKIRYRHSGQPATVSQTGEDMLFVEFDEPQRAITKGQAAVIYDGEIVIGGGTIV